MEEEVYIYEGVEYTREELEAEYGDRVDEAIETYFEVKKKRKAGTGYSKISGGSSGYLSRAYRAFRDGFRRY